MNLTNKNNFPEALVKAIANDSYSKGDAHYSITQLLKPPRQARLAEIHKDELTEDVEDRLWALYGQIVHSILERANEKDLVEKRYFAEFDGIRISGAIDSLVLKDGVLSDWKFSTAWSFKQSEPKADWIAQLNMQAELLRQNGIEVERLQIIGLIRDWQIRDAKNNPDSYPQSQVVIQNIPMWSQEQTQSFIKMRIALHEASKAELPECSTEERWAKPDVWAVMRGARAIPGGIQYSKKVAEELLSKTAGARIEFRSGESTNCELYCRVADYCDQFKKMKGDL